MTFVMAPFASSGDKDVIPKPIQAGGEVSFAEGFGVDYQADPGDPDVLYPERGKFNELMFQITNLLTQYQGFGFPLFLTSTDNSGTPYLYSVNSYVRFDDGSGFDIYVSLVDANDTDPTDTTKWRRLAGSSLPTGVGMDFHGATLPAGGWVWGNGNTVGNASSGGTNRANADTQALFFQLWNDYPNAILPIQDSTGAASTRGATAALDFAANKRMPVPNKRDRVSAGRGNMGGTSDIGLLTSAGSSLDGTVLGNTGGVQNVILAENQLPAHSHAPGTLVANTAGDHAHTITPGITGSGTENRITTTATPSTPLATSTAGAHTHTIGGVTAPTGSGVAHTNVQPTLICNYIIKL